MGENILVKILYVTTISNTVNAFLIPHIKMLSESGHTVDVAFNIEQEVNQEIESLNCKIHQVNFSRFPLKNNYRHLIRKVKNIVSTEKYDIVHTHTPIASAIVRIACRNLKNVKVVYTAHGFHFYKGAPLINWLTYYPIEKVLSRYTELIITINKEDYKIASEKFHSNQVKYIHGIGFNYYSFSNNKCFDGKNILGIPNNSYVITSVGELNTNKNHKVIIKAISRLNNSNIHYLIVGSGPLENELINLINRLGLQDNIHLLGYRKDISDILSCSDAFAFPSLREGLGISALEAMAAGLPILTSNVHGIKDYSLNGLTGFNYNPTDIEGFSEGINILMNMKEKESELLAETNKKIAHKYDLEIVLNEMNKIYESINGVSI